MAKKKGKKGKPEATVTDINKMIRERHGNLEPTSADDWKKTPNTTDQVPLPLPSGNTCLVQPLGIPELLKRGLIPNPLMQTVTEVMEISDFRMTNPTPAQVKAAEKKRRKELADRMETWNRDPEKMVAVFDMADTITLACVVKPPVHPVPEPDEDGTVSREAGRLYIDEVDLDDKLWIMSYAMSGARDLESFRAELASSVAATAAGRKVEPDTE